MWSRRLRGVDGEMFMSLLAQMTAWTKYSSVLTELPLMTAALKGTRAVMAVSQSRLMYRSAAESRCASYRPSTSNWMCSRVRSRSRSGDVMAFAASLAIVLILML